MELLMYRSCRSIVILIALWLCLFSSLLFTFQGCASLCEFVTIVIVSWLMIRVSSPFRDCVQVCDRCGEGGVSFTTMGLKGENFAFLIWLGGVVSRDLDPMILFMHWLIVGLSSS